MELPFRLIRPFLGARIIKTGLAVFLALAVFQWFGSSYATFAAVSAILAVQPSVTRVKEILGQQLLGNLVGGVVGAALGLWLGPSPIAMALGVVLVLGFCVSLKLTEAASLAVVAVIFIMDRPQHDFLLYTLYRVGAVTAGMMIGHLVNRFVHPPDFSKSLKDELQEAASQVDRFASRLVASLPNPQAYSKDEIKAEVRAIQERLDAAGLYLDLHRERHPDDPGVLALAKATSSLFVFTERITDIHKIVLHLGGLSNPEESTIVAGALTELMHYKQDVVKAALEGTAMDPVVEQACGASVSQLRELVQHLVADPHTRERGLSLHGVLTNVTHMLWRTESLARIL